MPPTASNSHRPYGSGRVAIMCSSGSTPKQATTGASFSPVEIFLPVHAAMFSRRDVHAHGVSIMHHYPVATDVHPVLIRIARDHDVTRANVTPAVALVPKRHRELEKIDVSAAANIFHHRTALDRCRRNICRPCQPLAPGLNETFPGNV